MHVPLIFMQRLDQKCECIATAVGFGMSTLGPLGLISDCFNVYSNFLEVSEVKNKQTNKQNCFLNDKLYLDDESK